MNFYLGYNRLGNLVDIPYGNTINFRSRAAPLPSM